MVFSWLDNYLTMPAKKPKPLKLRRQVWSRRTGVWILLGERDYLYPVEAVEFCHAWLARAEKHPQSSILPP